MYHSEITPDFLFKSVFKYFQNFGSLRHQIALKLYFTSLIVIVSSWVSYLLKPMVRLTSRRDVEEFVARNDFSAVAYFSDKVFFKVFCAHED